MSAGVSAPLRLDGTFVPIRAPAVAALQTDGEVVLVDEPTGRLQLLNPSGALLWECFDGQSSIGEICADVAEVLDVAFEQVLRDTIDIVSDLVAGNVVLDARAARPSGDESESSATIDRDAAAGQSPRVLPEPPNH